MCNFYNFYLSNTKECITFARKFQIGCNFYNFYLSNTKECITFARKFQIGIIVYLLRGDRHF